jgi:type II secretory pathway pseudopilin PulG
MERRGFTFTETLIVGVVFAIVLLGGTWLLSMERARARDAMRLADMTRVANAFSLIYAQSASYEAAAAGCQKIAQPVSACTLATDVPGLAEIDDPGRFEYIVTRVPDREDFGIRFRLERSYGTLAAGYHTLSKNGIR